MPAFAELKNNHEFQASLVRLGIWGAAVAHILILQSTALLTTDFSYYLWAFGFYLIVFCGILLSVLIRPVWGLRQNLSMVIDICATTTFFLLPGDAINPFSLLYLWIVVSYGARYGKRHLFYSSAGCATAYIGVAMVKGLFNTEPTETIFFLFFLLVLPVYQHMIISGRIAAEQATEVKNRFLSTMTHELRTPLSGVIGMSRLLESTPLDSEQREYLKSIQSASDVLMSLIGDILDFSKIEAKRMIIDKASFDIRETVWAVCQLLSNRAEEKNLELICRIDEGVPAFILSDEIRIKQILYNLIGNAIKFTERGEVEVRVSTVEGHGEQTSGLEIKVQDTGPGIPSDKLKRIFEGFWQENLSVTRRHGGTGLGTTIALELAKLLGGEVDVTSTPGVGSTFRFLLPLDARANPATPAAQNQRQFSGKTILVLERNQSSFDAISNTLAAAGAQIIERSSLEDSRIALVVLADDCGGLDLKTLVRRELDTIGANVPVLVLGYATRQYRLDLPRWAFLPKPFTPQQLRTAIARLLDSHPKESDPDWDVPKSKARAMSSPTRVLVAEDEPINARLMQTLLTKRGHQATLVENGRKALMKLSEECFDLAILDVRMPEMGGIEVAKRLRDQEKRTTRHIPIVALTASAINEVREECLAAGMDEFLLKPINPALLDDLIERYTTSQMFPRNPAV